MPFSVEHAVGELNAAIARLPMPQAPAELYEPIRYLLSTGGKRMRPTLALAGCYLFGDEPKQALPAALAVEVFHNFTLMHDDIMDKAPLRRGRPTVHEKWSEPVAILSGDAMLVKAYDCLLEAPPELLPRLMGAFNACALEVCEGQQFDMNFERMDEVPEADYLDMIRRKTAVLLGCALEMGALSGGASESQAADLRDFGVNVGIGFQLKDDLLDVYGDQAKFGKQVGGDIVANKKTFLLIKALELAEGAQREELARWLAAESFDPAEKVAAVKAIYDALQAPKLAEAKMDAYFAEAFLKLEALDADEGKKRELRGYAEMLVGRES